MIEMVSSFKDRFNQALAESGLRAVDVADKVGITEATISQYRSGRAKPKDDRLVDIANVLHVSPVWLMGLNVDKMDLVVEPVRKDEEFHDRTYQRLSAYYNKFLEIQRGYVSIPVLGQVAAGIPIEMIEDVIDYEDITLDMANDGTYFGLQIKGDSMEPRIYDGDVVIVKKQDYCDNNDIAIVTVNGYDATCKRILKNEGGITLMPLNTRHTPQMFTNEQIENIPVRIIGLVVEVRGKLKF